MSIYFHSLVPKNQANIHVVSLKYLFRVHKLLNYRIIERKIFSNFVYNPHSWAQVQIWPISKN